MADVEPTRGRWLKWLEEHGELSHHAFYKEVMYFTRIERLHLWGAIFAYCNITTPITKEHHGFGEELALWLPEPGGSSDAWDELCQVVNVNQDYARLKLGINYAAASRMKMKGKPNFVKDWLGDLTKRYSADPYKPPIKSALFSSKLKEE